MAHKRREPESWPDWESPMLLPVTGFRDQRLRITYLPWSSASLGAVGWEVFPDERPSNALIYIVPAVDSIGTLEIRCHLTHEKPDPTTDRLLGVFQIPPTMLDGK